MPKLMFTQVYKDDVGLYDELLPKWIAYNVEIDANGPDARQEAELVRDLKRRIRIQGTRDDMHFVLLHIDDELLGFANFAIDTGTVYGMFEPGYGTVLEFYIIPAMRRKGYGRILYEYVEGVLLKDGAKHMYLCPDSVTGVPFWATMGFIDSGKVDPDVMMPLYVKQLRKD